MARDPWWVIGSAAVALHGHAVAAGDVDVLLSVADAPAIAAALGRPISCGSDHPLFRSERFFTWYAPPLAVEFMAGFTVRQGDSWCPVAPFSRECIIVGAVTMFVPSRGELREMLLGFGRDKDVARAALLEVKATWQR